MGKRKDPAHDAWQRAIDFRREPKRQAIFKRVLADILAISDDLIADTHRLCEVAVWPKGVMEHLSNDVQSVFKNYRAVPREEMKRRWDAAEAKYQGGTQ